MSCYHPITAWDVTPDFEHGVQREIVFSLGRYWREHPFYSLVDCEAELRRQGRRLELPCRHCVGCRLDKSREWANRVVMEQLYHSDSWFLTLTYNDEYLPRSFATDPETGEILSVHSTLVKSHVQDFLKLLRYHCLPDRIRYFMSGEYGMKTYRPHYHLLIFGLKLNDLSQISSNFAGQPYFVSKLITSLWPYGIHILGPVTWQSAAYVARYTMKKATHGFDKSWYSSANIVPEYQSMSLKPGIGYQYFLDHPDIMDYSTFNVATPQGGRRMSPPEYFKRKFRDKYPDEYLKRSLNCRLEADVKKHLKLLLTDKDYLDILKDDERRALSRLSTLTRDDI